MPDGGPAVDAESIDGDGEPDDPPHNELLDQTFGEDGVVSLDLYPFTRLVDLAIVDDGSIYYVEGPSGSSGRVCRLSSTGSTNVEFGDGWNCKSTDGKAALGIVEGGVAIADNPPGAVAIARYSLDGERDMTFGGDGSVDFVPPREVWVRPLRVAATVGGGVAAFGEWLEPSSDAPWIATVDGAGTVLGETHAAIPGGGFAHDLVPLPSGAVITLAHTFPSLDEPVEVLAKYLADATPDPTFNEGEFWQTRDRGPTEVGPLGEGLWSVASEQGTWVGRVLEPDGTAHDAVELHPARRPGDKIRAGIRLRDGRWLLVGVAGAGLQAGPVVWLLSAEGAPASDFADGGRLRFALPTPHLRIDRIEETADGAVVVAIGDEGDLGSYLVRVRP